MIRVVGLGPGHASLLTFQAAAALAWAETVVGYKGYLELIDPAMLQGRELIATGMTGEMARCDRALAAAMAGKRTVVVGSGDAGVYGLAGLVIELAGERGLLPELTVEVVAGVPALIAAAALLGAPLTHDFAAVSLSDLLTPWAQIESRLEHAAAGDFVIGLYNPRSRRRDWQLERARDVLLGHRAPDTPVGVVRLAFRPGQEIRIMGLKELRSGDADMFTMIIVGNSRTKMIEGRLVTPRGYLDAYSAETLARRDGQ